MMMKIKVVSLLVATFTLSTIAIADYLPLTDKNESEYQCFSSASYVDGTAAPTVSIVTSNRLVQGLCMNGGNQANGVTLGQVTQNGHLIKLPVAWKEADGTIRTLNDLCFKSQADPKKRNFFNKNREGRIGIFPESGAATISCHEGCSGQKIDFGTNGFC